MKNNILITLLFILILNGCNFITPQNNEKNNKDTLFIEKDALQKDKSVEDFAVFYENFFSDSTFQISRILFPLEGWHYSDEPLIHETENYIWKGGIEYLKPAGWKVILYPTLQNYNSTFKLYVKKELLFDSLTLLGLDQALKSRKYKLTDVIVGITLVDIKNEVMSEVQLYYRLRNHKWQLYIFLEDDGL